VKFRERLLRSISINPCLALGRTRLASPDKGLTFFQYHFRDAHGAALQFGSGRDGFIVPEFIAWGDPAAMGTGAKRGPTCSITVHLSAFEVFYSKIV